MDEKPSQNNILFYIGLVLLLITGIGIGVYHYLLDYYTDRVVSNVGRFLEGFSPEDIESLISDEELKTRLTEWQKNREDQTKDADSTDDTNDNNDTTGTPDNNGTDASNGDHEGGSTDRPPEGSTPATPAPELPFDVEKSIAEKLTTQDIYFITKIYRRFPASEVKVLERYYYEGGNAGEVKKLVENRLTPAEIDKSIDIALRVIE